MTREPNFYDYFTLTESDELKRGNRIFSSGEKIKAIFDVATDSRLAEFIASGRLTPVDNLNQAEFHDRTVKIQQLYKQNPQLFLHAVDLAVKLNNGMINDKELFEWADRKQIPTDVSFSAGYIADIITDPSQREKLKSYQWTVK